MPNAGLRDEIVTELERELLGPRGGPDEIFAELPTQRYISGVLYPRESEPTGEEAADVEPEGEGDDDIQTRSVRSGGSRLKRPSAMGLSFLVETSTRLLTLSVKWATYAQKERRRVFRRHEHTQIIELDVSDLGDRSPTRLYAEGDPIGKEFVVTCSVYEGPQATKHVTVFVINEEDNPKLDAETGYPDKAQLAQRCIYSPTLEIQSPSGEIAAMSERVSGVEDQDFRTLRLLYRDRHEFGHGHGCSVVWEDVAGNHCGTLRTTFLPRYLQASIVVETEGAPPLHMFDLFQPPSKEELLARLEALVRRYEEWIASTFSLAARDVLNHDLRDVFDLHRDRCGEAVRRMRAGLALLSKDAVTYEAFSFMNKAMFLQKAYASASQEAKVTGTFRDPDVMDASIREMHSWRAFQMAFILMSLPGMANPTHEDRNLVDLLWVPTGAGKTEAYLGLAVFVMAYQRLSRGVNDPCNYAGVTVLLRYTLRLLTIQQFQRASALMCACEKIRLGRPDRYGTEPFLVGLYIGQSTTPNRFGRRDDYENHQKDPVKNAESKNNAWYALEFWRQTGSKPSDSNPFQLTHCPWCGSELHANSYDILEAAGGSRLEVHCPRRDCLFHREASIPVVTVDDEIYSRLPPLLISTVDKFAMLTFLPRVAMLFGRVTRYCPQDGFLPVDEEHARSHRIPGKAKVVVRVLPEGLEPPGLIIQDELHLINGPLGSLVGMFESTIRFLCTLGRPATPKLVASTATVRRAFDQVWYLFGKETRPFPPPGLDFEDSFFVRERRPPDSKMYVGVFPSGTALTTGLIRTMVTVLSKGADFKAGTRPASDWTDYWTTVAYFNSIRELGSSKTRIEDDIQRRVQPFRGELRIEELTSRIDSKDLPEILSKLNIEGGETGAVDVLACSNMFSVGVDVQRLGVMIMNGQPKSTAEYIQSTGRVGRRNAGLVLVLFNWVRSRDRSHFERFFDYHNRVHSHVESLTVTPFSEGVRARALHAQFVALSRAVVPNLSKNVEAGNFTTATRASPDVRQFVEWLKQRAAEAGENPALVERQLQDFMDRWIFDSDPRLRYHKQSRWDTGGKYLLRAVDEDRVIGEAGPRILTPTSMRNIEREVRPHFVSLSRIRKAGR